MNSQSNRYFALVLGSILVAFSLWGTSHPQLRTQTASEPRDRDNLLLIAGVEHDDSDIPER